MHKFLFPLFCSPDGSLRPGWRFALCLAFFLFAEYACVYATIAVMGESGNAYLFEAIYRPLLLVGLLFGFSSILKGTDKAAKNPIAAQGLSWRLPWRHQFICGGIFGLGIVTVAVVAVVVFGGYSTQFNPVDTWKTVIVLWILLTSAGAEEVAFRGYPFQTLARATGRWGAVLLMSALFGAIHLNNPHASLLGMLNTMLIGILLSLAYLRTKALWLPIGLHFGWNLSLGCVYGLPVSGVSIFAILVHGTATGSRLLTGGDYGLEASVTAAGAICLGIVLLMLATSQRRSPKLLAVVGIAGIKSSE